MLKLSRSRAVLGAAGGVLACTTLAGAQISQSIGTDVIVGDLPAVEHWTTSGAVNGMRAYSVGTTSCNQGSSPLSWRAGPNPNHPVINQALYRYADDPTGLVDANGAPVKRFEQLGQSWLKHGFTALQGSLCSGEFDFPCQPTAGTSLGVGCSDPYGASLNGGQTGLGPKYEINPALGTNLGNHATPSGGALGGRIQVLETDLTVPGALFFVEGQYIAADDAAAGNDDNNASYRKVLVNTANFDLNMSGATHRREAAIMAWADNDPSVTVQQVDVPGDGRFTVAYKVTDLGGGVYDYDYAIFNMNSDRAGAALRFPLAAGLTVLGSDFHDVNYHSGEPYDNTDWTISNTGDQLVFASPQTFAENETTNALRWGTTYNFRFQTNAAPVAGIVALDLFKPGSPTTMNIVAMVPSGGVAFNDDCAGALAISSYGAFPFDTTSATTDGPPDPACDEFSFDSIDQDLWYSYTATCDGQYTASTCGSAFDTRLAIYAGGCPGAGGAIVDCADDSSCEDGGIRQTSLTWTGIAGTEYLIRVGGYQGSSGPGVLTLSGPPCLPIPANDLCTGAETLAERVSLSGTTAGANADAFATCGGNADVFYAFTPSVDNVFAIDVNTGTLGAATLSVLNGCNGAEVACSPSGSLVAALDGGHQYLIRVATAPGQADGSFSIRAQGDVVNDDCANATPIYDGIPVNGTNTDATGTNITSCAFDNDVNDVWYAYTPATSGTITADTCGGATFDTSLAAFASCGGAQLACNDDNCGLQSGISWSAVGGTTYLIRVAGYGAQTGDFTLSVTGGGGSPVPENDDCASAIALSDGIAVSGSNVGATGTDITSCTNNDTKDVWYAYTVTADGTVGVTTCGSALDTSLAVFDGCGGAELTCNDDNDIACGADTLQSALTFAGQAGHTYLIRVAGWNANVGTFTITAAGGSAPPAPINDDCVNIYAVPANATLPPIDTTSATLDGPADDGCGGGAVGADVWFGLGSHAADGTATFSTTGSDYDTVITVYDDSAGACENLPARVIDCNDNAGGTQQSELTLPVAEGHTYIIRVSGRNGDTGQLIFTSSFTAAPPCVCETDGVEAQVDVFDLLAYLDLWFVSDPGADIDGAAGVDVFDLLAYLDCWFPASAGAPC